MPATTAPTQTPNFPPGTVYVELSHFDPSKNKTIVDGFIGWNGREYLYDYRSTESRRMIPAYMKVPVIDRETTETVSSNEPERFLKWMCYQYQNYGGMASQPRQM